MTQTEYYIALLEQNIAAQVITAIKLSAQAQWLERSMIDRDNHADPVPA